MHDTSVHCRSVWSPTLMAGDVQRFSTTNAMALNGSMMSDYSSKILKFSFYLTLAHLYSDKMTCPHDGYKILAKILRPIFVQMLSPILLGGIEL